MLGFLRSFFGRNAEPESPADSDVIKPIRLVETSMNFDTENVGLFLHWVNSTSSLTLPEDFIADVVIALPDIAVDTTESFKTAVTTAIGKEALKLNIFMDDIDAPDLYFFGSEIVIGTIDACMKSFAEEHGL